MLSDDDADRRGRPYYGQMEHVQGAQAVSRAGLLLRTVSAGDAKGLASSEVSARSGLTRPTTHRMLVALAREGLVDQDSASGRWFPGPELFLMGAVAAARYDISDLAGETLRVLSARTGESAFLSARRGDETVCLLREEGSFPIRSFVLHEGVRFPLGVASAGIAILAFLPPAQVDAFFLRNPALDQRWGATHSESAIRARSAETRSRGYAVNPGLIVEGSWGMGAAVFDQRGEPTWALSLTGVGFRFPEERQRELGSLLLEQAHELTKRLGTGR